MRLDIRCAAKPTYHHHPYLEGVNQFHLISKENIFFILNSFLGETISQ